VVALAASAILGVAGMPGLAPAASADAEVRRVSVGQPEFLRGPGDQRLELVALRGQDLTVTVDSYAPEAGPCDAQATFVDPNGAVLAGPTCVGHGGSLGAVAAEDGTHAVVLARSPTFRRPQQVLVTSTG